MKSSREYLEQGIGEGTLLSLVSGPGFIMLLGGWEVFIPFYLLCLAWYLTAIQVSRYYSLGNSTQEEKPRKGLWWQGVSMSFIVVMIIFFLFLEFWADQ